MITKIEPNLFQIVTGLTVADFQLLVSLRVFNTEQMNQAVFAFRRYENASLRYTGIESHDGLTHYGLYDTVVAREEVDEAGALAVDWEASYFQTMASDAEVRREVGDEFLREIAGDLLGSVRRSGPVDWWNREAGRDAVATAVRSVLEGWGYPASRLEWAVHQLVAKAEELGRQLAA